MPCGHTMMPLKARQDQGKGNYYMRGCNVNGEWILREGVFDLSRTFGEEQESVRTVNLPHDFMIETEVRPDAVSGPAMGYYEGGIRNYTKNFFIPDEWKEDQIYLSFDGVMGNTTVEVNGSFVTRHHYGYTPFLADLTPYVTVGSENRVTVTVNASMQPSSRWYAGAGIYRDVELIHAPKIHIAKDGIYAYTERISYENGAASAAYVTAEVTVENHTDKNHVVAVEASFLPENFTGNPITRSSSLGVKAHSSAVTRIRATLPKPALWDVDHPNLYTVRAAVKDLGIFTTALVPAERVMTDEAEVLFGVRTVSADSANGLRINETPVILKGGCIHHDNGVLGAVSFYDSEYRKLKRLKDAGYNAVRLAHNPPSAVLLEACDRLGMYVMDEAFDCWEMGKQAGDYSQFFRQHWKEDLRAFILRDRCHPSVIFWSTGNEIFERGGLGDGYALCNELIDEVRALDGSRLITNGFCSFWSGLDDEGMRRIYGHIGDSQASLQNVDPGTQDTSLEDVSEPFVNNLDVVGYNYLDNHYELAGKLYPERVIVGTESYPKEMDRVWEKVEQLPYIIGDFTWTCYDYIGEAGIGKSAFFDDAHAAAQNVMLTMSSHTSPFPWRLGNDADFDINGNMLPQGHFRRILWGSSETYICSYDPAVYGKTEVVSMWGWPDVSENWNWRGQEGNMVQVLVYSAAEEVELYLNGKSVGIHPAGKEHRFTAAFELPYEPGRLEAVSRCGGTEISRSTLSSTGEAASVRLVPEKINLTADGQSLAYVGVEIVDASGAVVTDAAVSLTARVSGSAVLAGFGSGNPVTAENYTVGKFTTYRGKCMAVLRSGREEGETMLTVSAPGLGSAEIKIRGEQ